MAIRRRRKTLTNLLSTMERRVTAVELRPINLLTSAQVNNALATEDETLDGGPNSVVSPNAPNQYIPIREGYYYSSRVTGGSPIVELYFETDTGLAKDKTIRISGVNSLPSGSNLVDFNISSDYKVLAVDTPPYEGRNSYGGQRHTPGENVTNTAVFSPAKGTEYSTRRSLVVRRQIASVEATTLLQK